MSLPADINDRYVAAAQKAAGASEIIHRFANDPEGAEIPTESGPLPSLKEWLRIHAAALGNLPAVQQFVNDLQNDSDLTKGAALVPRALRFINSIAELRALDGRYNGETILLSGYYAANPGPGGGHFRWIEASAQPDDGAMFIAATGAGRWVRQFDGATVHLEWFGAVNDTDAVPQLRAARDYLARIGGGVIRARGRYLVDSGNVEIDADNILIDGYGPGKTIFERTSVQTGFAFWWARNTETNGGGLKNCELIGNNSNVSGNGGVAFGYDNGSTGVYIKANGYECSNVVCRRWSQYGIGINSGDGWLVHDIRVLEHGIVSGYMASCMGFYVYPKATSKGGRLYNIYSEINPDSQAIANNAAIKIQTHENLQAEMIYGKGGSEQCIGFDSIKGVVKNVVARANAAAPGITIGNYNSAHIFRGEFTLDGVDCDDAGFSVALVMGSLAEGDTEPKLKNCTIKNVKASTFRVNNRSAWQNCTFDNIKCSIYFRLDHATAGVTAPTVAITGNTYKDIAAPTIEIRGDSSQFFDCVATAGAVAIVGSNNTLDGPKSIGSASNGMVIEGSANTLTNLLSKGAAGRKIWVKSGDANVFHGVCIGGTAILNSGTNTNTTHLVQI